MNSAWKTYLEVNSNLSGNSIFPSLCHTFQGYSKATPLGRETPVLGRCNISAFSHNFKLYKNYPGLQPNSIQAPAAALPVPACGCNVSGGQRHCLWERAAQVISLTLLAGRWSAKCCSISNDKTALWAILACQSWHSFLSLPKTPSCNA